MASTFDNYTIATTGYDTTTGVPPIELKVEDIDFPALERTIHSTAEATLRRYSNNKIKALGLATKAYKYDFPYNDSYYIKESNYRFFILLEKRLFSKIPYLDSPNCKFWNKSKTHITLLLTRDQKTVNHTHNGVTRTRIVSKANRYTNMIWKKLRVKGFDLSSSGINISNSETFLESSRTYEPCVKILINLNAVLFGAYGMAKLLFFYEDVEKIFINLQKLSFYETVQENQNTSRDTANTATASAT